jgi:predicted class III extradiol MEMO1 family dioxygenase
MKVGQLKVLERECKAIVTQFFQKRKDQDEELKSTEHSIVSPS